MSLRVRVVALLSASLVLCACATDVQQLTVPAADAQMFEQQVYPVLLRDCGFPACHGDRRRFFQVFGPGRTRYREGDGGTDNFEPATAEELLQTYTRARSMLAFEKSPLEALLVRKPLATKAGGAGHKGTDNWGNDVYRTSDASGFLTLRAWALSTPPGPRQETRVSLGTTP